MTTQTVEPRRTSGLIKVLALVSLVGSGLLVLYAQKKYR